MTGVRPALIAVLAAGCATQSLLGVEAPDREYWKGYFLDAGEVLASPREWEGGDWLAFGGVLVCASALYSEDGHIREEVLDARTDFSEDLAEFSERFGDGVWLSSGLSLTYCLALACDDARLKEAALLGLESFAVSGAFTTGLKWLFGRRRPGETTGPDEFVGPTLCGSVAMPSGHTAVAFAVASSFALEYENPWVSALAYTLAGLVGWSRIHDDAHWASDVFVGAVVGVLTARGIYRARARRKTVTSSAPDTSLIWRLDRISLGM